MKHPALSRDVLVADLLVRFPQLARLFVEMRLGCAGCSMSRFCTLEEVSIQYELEIEEFLAQARARISHHETSLP
jgi:hybrid cluster-associated redox disulfide protein